MRRKQKNLGLKIAFKLHNAQKLDKNEFLELYSSSHAEIICSTYWQMIRGICIFKKREGALIVAK